MSQFPLVDQFLLEERQRLEREFRTHIQMSLLGFIIGGALIGLFTPSWLWVSAFAAVLSLAWWRIGPRIAQVHAGRLATRHGVWSKTLLVSAASALAYQAHQSRVNAHGSRYIDHSARVAAKLAGDSDAVAVAWLHAVLEDRPDLEHEVRAFPANIRTAVLALTRRAAPSRPWHEASIEHNDLAAKVRAASDALVAAQKDRVRRYRERAAQHELTVGPQEQPEVSYDEAA